ncbi:hypothetical protein BGZ60DRAFT_432533 [Tricladium varicosporioides]|nr:hypothetical protein BGZ60DRAFT_432533 [Hymenoscyphus varicosporioides]
MEDQPNTPSHSDTTTNSDRISVVSTDMSSLDLQPSSPISIPTRAMPARSNTIAYRGYHFHGDPIPEWVNEPGKEEAAAEWLGLQNQAGKHFGHGLDPPGLSPDKITIPFLDTPTDNHLISRHGRGVPAGISLIKFEELEEMKRSELPRSLAELYRVLNLYPVETLQHSGEEVLLWVQKSVVEKIDIQAELGRSDTMEEELERHTRYIEKFRALDPDVQGNFDAAELRSEVLEDIQKDKESLWADSSKEKFLDAIINFIDDGNSWFDRGDELGDIMRDVVKFAEGKGTMTDSTMGQPRLAIVASMDWIRVIRWEAEYYCWLLDIINAEVDSEVLRKVKVLIDLAGDTNGEEVVSADS